MSQSQRSPLPILVFAIALAFVAFAGARFWNVWRQNSELKVQVPESDTRDLQTLAEQRRTLDETHRLATQRQTRLKDECAQLQKSQMPLTPAATRELQLQVLELARRCEFEIEEISPVTTANNPSTGAAAPLTGKERPQVRLQCQAGFQGIAKFVAGLSGLKWTVTPESFSIGQPETSTAVSGEESVPRNQPWQNADSLSVKMVLTF